MDCFQKMKKKAKTIRREAAKYAVVQGQLYKRGLNQLVLNKRSRVRQEVQERKWGVDLLGPFPVTASQVKYLIVATNCYTKWVEAEPLASISSTNCQKFLLRQVIARFGIPKIVVSDNSTQTTPQSSTGETLFRLSYGIDAMIPINIEEPSSRLLLGGSSEVIEKNLIDETWELAHLSEAALKEGKLSPNWEGPYRVKEVHRKGAYMLEWLDGKEVPRIWNTANLRRFYS
ncbi:uncharacterized protein [Arachis hypogaea]|uniref:uncharacterized protein n=1 Tax=Arachis hypogaea TaxID=3818 RepID=UPI003B2189C4